MIREPVLQLDVIVAFTRLVTGGLSDISARLFIIIPNWITVLISTMRNYHFLPYLYTNYHPHICCYYNNVSAVAPSSLHQVLNDPGKLQGIPYRTLYLQGLDCSRSADQTRNISSSSDLVLLSNCSSRLHWIQVCTARTRDWTYHYHITKFPNQRFNLECRTYRFKPNLNADEVPAVAASAKYVRLHSRGPFHFSYSTCYCCWSLAIICLSFFINGSHVSYFFLR